MKILKSKREEFFPWIKDWSDPQDKVRHHKNVSELDYFTWLFLHPSAYKLIYYGIPSMGIFVFGLCSLLSYFVLSSTLFSIIFALMAFIFVFSLYRKYQKRFFIKDTTLYDLFMRDYPLEDSNGRT